MKKLILSLAALLLILTACKEHVDTSARYVFKESTVASYLSKHEEYSEYVKLMKLVPVSEMSKSSVYQLMTARGNYTCFAITNDAIQAYLQDLVDEGLIAEPSWDSFTDSAKIDSIRKVIVRNSVIDGGDLESQRYTLAMFPTDANAELPLPNLNDHKLTVSYDSKDPEVIIINGECNIDKDNRDIPTLNGVIHRIDKVIAPKDITAARWFQDILDNKTEGYLMMAKVIQACGLLDTLTAIRDETYESLYQANKIPDMEDYQDKGGGDKSATSGDPDAHAPEHRKYGFTIFAETDDYWRSQGIDPTASNALEQLQNWILSNNMYLTDGNFLTDNNYSNPKHILYDWVTYHMLPMRIPSNKLVYHCNEVGYNLATPYKYSIPVMEWYPSMGQRRLLKIFESKESNGVYLNRFPVLNNGRHEDGHENYCLPAKVGCLVMRDDSLAQVNDVVNACIYPIDAPLAYTDATRDELGKERLRFDLMSLFPEAITNGIRRADSSQGKYQHVYINQDQVYQYFSNMSILNEETHFIHYNGYKINWCNYCQDEDKAFGRFDIRFALPPVPKTGTYEVRYKVLATSARGVVQVYFGTDPDNLPVTGIPIDMTESTQDCFGESISIDDTEDEDADAEVDHKLRNHSIMKSGRHEVNESDASLSARDDHRCTRHIVWRGTMYPDKKYYIRFKSVLDSDTKELYLDYFEFCPKEVYDNPSTPEDVW